MLFVPMYHKVCLMSIQAVITHRFNTHSRDWWWFVISDYSALFVDSLISLALTDHSCSVEGATLAPDW